MPDSLFLVLPALLAGAVVGFAAALLWRRGYVAPDRLLAGFAPRGELVALAAARESAERSLAEARNDLTAANVQADGLAERCGEQERELATLRQSTATLTGQLATLTERQRQQESDFAALQARSRAEFSEVSSRLLASSGAALREDHARTLKSLLDPVHARLVEFQTEVDRKFSEEAKEKASLKTQIEQLASLNQNLSHEARQLALALKGDSKTQGDWGELQLERLLEAAGLHAETHFDTQLSFRDASGRQQRPDCIVRLPQGRCLIVDSKVSLTAYERFCASEDDGPQRERELLAHVASLRSHIKGLSAKRYQDLYEIDCPDYVLLFVPIEPAFIAAVRARTRLFTEALEANVVLVSPSTLLATMRTVAYMWQQEDQRANAQKIAEVGRKLYDKFVGFVEDMDAVGHSLDRARDTYEEAMNKLSRSPKRATTLVARAQELKALGVASSKELTPAA